MLLAAAFASQLVATDDRVLPQPGPLARPAAALDPLLLPATGERAIVARSMFAPSAARLAPGAAPAGPLGARAIVGSIRIGRADFAVVQGPGTQTAYVRPGGRIGEWRLYALMRSEALLRRGAERLTVPFGARDVAGAAAGENR